MLHEFKDSEGVDLTGDPMAMQRLKDAAEKAKCDLSSLNTTEINLPFIANDANGARHLNVEVSRETLEKLVSDIVSQTLNVILKYEGDVKKAQGELGKLLEKKSSEARAEGSQPAPAKPAKKGILH